MGDWGTTNSDPRNKKGTGLGCMGLGPNATHSLVPFHGMAGWGGFQRRVTNRWRGKRNSLIRGYTSTFIIIVRKSDPVSIRIGTLFLTLGLQLPGSQAAASQQQLHA